MKLGPKASDACTKASPAQAAACSKTGGGMLRSTAKLRTLCCGHLGKMLIIHIQCLIYVRSSRMVSRLYKVHDMAQKSHKIPRTGTHFRR